MNQTDRFCAEDNKKLIEHLKNKGVIKSPLVFETMCLVDRKKFVNKFNPFNNAYIDAPQNIGHGRTISAPHMHGVVFEILAEKLTTAKNVLCIRCSTGYVSNCMSIMMGPYGTVFHTESIPELKEKIIQTIEHAHPYLLWGNRIQLLNVENESAGYPQPKIRYDVIYVGAAAAEIPQALIDQLAFGGRLVIPIGPKEGQKLMQIDKTLDGRIEKRTITAVRYGYLDGPREITKENIVPTIRAENRSNEKFASNSRSESLNNIISEKIQTQSTTKIQNNLPTKPAQNHFDGCMKDNLAQTTTEKLEFKTDEKVAQPNIKKTEIKNLPTILHELTPTLNKKIELKADKMDDLYNLRKTEDTQEKSPFGSSSESRISHEMMKTQLSMKMQNNSPITLAQNHPNSCMKDDLAQTTTEKLEIKTGEKVAQQSIKQSEGNLHKTLQELPTLEKKFDSKDYPQNVGKTEDVQLQNVPNLDLNSKLKPVLDAKVELRTTMNELTPAFEIKTLEKKIEETYQIKFDKAVEKLKNDFKKENLQSTYVDEIMKKLTLLLDKKLETKIDENLNVKIGSIEQRVILLEDEIKKFNDTLKQETNEQKMFLCEMDKALKIKIEKLKSKIGSVEKDSKVTERKLNNKIVKVKECIDEKIIEEVDELSKQLKMLEEANELYAKDIKKLSIAFEERLLQEKANIYMQIDAELEKKEQRELNSVKNNIACFEKEMELLKKKLIDRETNKREQWCYCFMAFPTIITLHATYALFKNLS